MVLSDLGPMGLGHDHAHEIVRLRVRWGNPHGVARMVFGFDQRALIEKHQRKRLRRLDIVGVEAHYSGEKRLCGRLPIFSETKLVEHCERAYVPWRAFEQRDERSLGVLILARRKRRARRMKIRTRPLFGP